MIAHHEPSISAHADPDPVYVIAEEVFASLVDGEDGHLQLWDGPPPAVTDEVHAWVDVHAPALDSRVMLSTEESSAQHLTRALLCMGPDEPVCDADLADALGEVANVVGGNVKALVPDTGAMTLPTVARVNPSAEPHDLLHRVSLRWRGRPMTVSVMRLSGQPESLAGATPNGGA